MTTLWTYMLQAFVLAFVFALASVFGSPSLMSVLWFCLCAYLVVQLYLIGWPLIKPLMDWSHQVATGDLSKDGPEKVESAKPLEAKLKGFQGASVTTRSVVEEQVDQPAKRDSLTSADSKQGDGKIFEVMVYKNTRRMLLCLDSVNVYAANADEAQEVALKYWKDQRPTLDIRCMSIRPAVKQDPIDYSTEAVKIVNLPFKVMCTVWDAIKTPSEQRGLRPPYVIT